MGFSSGGTHTGTDTNLSGLTSVTGTTTFALPSGITVYQVSSELTINGALSYDPNTEWLWSTRSDGGRHITIGSGGSLTVNGTITGNGTFNRRNPALLFTGSRETLAVANAENTGDLVVNSGGTLSLTGIRMQQASHVFYLAGSTVTINDCILEATVDGSSGTTGRRIRNFNASTITNCILNGVAYDAFNASATLTNPLWESVYYAVECVSDLGFGGDNNVYTVSSPNIRASVFDIGNFAGAKISVTNLNSGVKLRAYHLYHLDNGWGSVPNGGCTKVLNSLNITAVNTAQVGVNTPSLFCRDTNNGNRVSITYRDSSVESFTADQTYFATGNSSGVFSVLQVLAYVVYGGRTPTSSSSPPVYDFRDTTGSEANLFNFIFACYGFLPTVAVINVSGLNSAARSVGQTLLTDSKITQATRATVAAYTTGQSTFSADKLYDYSAYDKTLSTGIEQPANAATRWAEDSGSSILIASAYELIVNSSLSGISVNHSTRKISISPLAAGTTFPGGIRLTNIELVNAGTQSVPVSVLASGVVKVADGTTNLTAWIFASGTQINLRSGATAATVQVSSVSGITAGSGVTLTTAPATVSVSVTGPSDYYVTIIQSGSRLNTSDTGIQSGTYSFTTSASGSAIVRVRRQGWRDFQTTITLVSGATATVGALLTQELDGSGNPLYAGTTSTLITVTVDGADAAHKINWTGNGTATAQLVYDEVQDAKVSAAGMLATGLQASFISFAPFLAAIVLPSTVKFRNQTPANLNCVFEGFAVQAAGALVDDTSGNGFIRVVASLGLTSQQSRDSMLLAPTVGATAATGSIDDLIAGISAGSGLTAQQVRDALKLAPTAGSPAAGSVDADLDTLVARNNPLDAAGTRTAVGLGSANLDTQLGAIDDFLDTEVAAIKAKTDNLPTDPADQSLVEAAITTAQTAIINQGNSAWVTANISSLLTSAAYTDSLPANFGALAISGGGLVTTSNPGGGATAAQVWGYTGGDRSLSGAQATNVAYLADIIAHTRPMAKQLGLVAGITATHTPTGITVSDGDGSTTITDNGGDSYTVEGA